MRLPWMTRADRRRWRAARTVADLGEVMALWLEGTVASRPGCAPNCGPDDKTLAPTLAALNRIRFLTVDSQPGVDAMRGFDGQTWMQRAAVTGFIADEDVLGKLRAVANQRGLLLTVTHRLPQQCAGQPIAVTLHGDNCDAYTVYGSHIEGRRLWAMWPVIRREAYREIAGAWQVTVAAEYGETGNRLWPLLDQAAGELWLDSLPADPDDERFFGGVDDTPQECEFCGAPHYSNGPYCSTSCEDVALGDSLE